MLRRGGDYALAIDDTDDFTRPRIDLEGIVAEVYARKGELIRTRKHFNCPLYHALDS